MRFRASAARNSRASASIVPSEYLTDSPRAGPWNVEATHAKDDGLAVATCGRRIAGARSRGPCVGVPEAQSRLPRRLPTDLAAHRLGRDLRRGRDDRVFTSLGGILSPAIPTYQRTRARRSGGPSWYRRPSFLSKHPMVFQRRMS